MTEKPPTKYMGLAADYGAKTPKKRGTPCRCPKCGWKTKIRLRKGTSLKNLLCWSCGSTGGFERYTAYDQERKNKSDK